MSVPLQRMVESLRVTELKSFLTSMGMDTKGLKKDLVQRATKHLRDHFCPELFSFIKELCDRRYSSRIANSRHHATLEVITMQTSVNVAADFPTKFNGPVHKHEVHMVKLPFYQTLETIVTPVSLGTAEESFHLKSFMSRSATICWFVSDLNMLKFRLCSSVTKGSRILYNAHLYSFCRDD